MKHRFFTVLLFAAIVFGTNILPSKAQTAETPAAPESVVLFVEFTFDEKDLDTAIDLMSQMQSKVLENEDGCVAYDVLMSDEEPNKIFVYESYENQDALKAHNNTPYFKEIVGTKLKKLIKSQKIKTLYLLNPDDGESGENGPADAEP